MTECFGLYLPNVMPVSRDFNSIHAVLSESMNSLDCSDSYSTFTNMRVLNIHIQEYHRDGVGTQKITVLAEHDHNLDYRAFENPTGSA